MNLPLAHQERLRAQAADLKNDLVKVEENLESARSRMRELKQQEDVAAKEVQDYKKAINQILELAGDEPAYPTVKTSGKRATRTVDRTCQSCRAEVKVHANTRKCPECGDLLVRPQDEEDDEDDDDSGLDEDEEDDEDSWDEDDDDPKITTRPLPPKMTDKEWMTKPHDAATDARIRKGCTDCTEIVYVMSLTGLCPLKGCNGRLVAAKETKGEAQG